MKIAIIGAGVSGLATAYYLYKEYEKKGMLPEITVYEKKSKVGGNAYTDFFIQNGQDENSFRWDDLGVNDFNAATYTKMVELWREIGIMSKVSYQSDYCKPLIDSTTYYKQDGSYIFSIDASGKFSKPFGSAANLDLLKEGDKKFAKCLAEWYKPNPPAGTDKILRLPQDCTVKEFADFYDLPQEYVDNMLYPRINAMYFSWDTATIGTPVPAKMPMWIVAHYYILQEGIGQAEKATNTRQYFINGSQRWLEKFASYQQEKYGLTIKYQTTVDKILKGQVTPQKTEYLLFYEDATGHKFEEYYHTLVVATHANTALNLLRDGLFLLKHSDKLLIEALRVIAPTYAPSTGFMHQDMTVLPYHKDFYAAYNVLIRNYHKPSAKNSTTTFQPYSMTYVANLHQGDANLSNAFLTTLNPQKNISSSMVFNNTQGGKTEYEFYHAELNLETIKAQNTINKIQAFNPEKPRSWFIVGHYVSGGGLHEECIIIASEIANKIVNPQYVSEQYYDFEGTTNRQVAPQYILDAIS